MSNHCTNCGLCCTYMGAPPFTAEADVMALPEQLRLDLNAYLDSPRFEDGGPCLWLNRSTGACLHYEHRPAVCREFEVGNTTCRTLRTNATPALTIEGLPPPPEDDETTRTT